MKEVLAGLPDYVFDLFCRFIPGAYVIFLVYLLDRRDFLEVIPFGGDGTKAIVLSLILGHIAQPPCSAVARGIIKIMDRDEKRNLIYKKHNLMNPEGSRLQRLVTKSYSEAVSMIALSIGSISVFFFLNYADAPKRFPGFLWGSAILLFFFALERLRARERKIDDMQEIAEEQIGSHNSGDRPPSA